MIIKLNQYFYKIQLLEMFDFYDDIYSGTLKRKLNILSFFQNTGLKIAKAIDRSFLHYLKTCFKEFRVKHEPLRKVIKVYEKPNTVHEDPPKKNNDISRKNELRKIFERNFNQIPNINEIIIDDNANECAVGSSFNLEKEIEEFFKENQPKNKGWLFRKSHEIGTNWQNLFFCLINNNSRLISLHPKTMKKALNINNIQIHKCNFLESIPHEAIFKKSNKKGSNTKKFQENENNSKKTFFILDLTNFKIYLVRSDESLAILSVINFYISKNKTAAINQNPTSLIQIIETVEPYYSGIIEIACCKKKDLNTFHSDLKSYSFKSQFLEIKSNKLLIYQYSLKDSLNLLEYDLKVPKNSQEDLHQGYMFSLEKKSTPHNANDLEMENNLKSMKESFVVFNTLYTHENNNINSTPIHEKPPSFLKPEESPNVNKNFKSSFNNNILQNQHFNDLEIIDEKDEGINEKRRKGGTGKSSFKEFLMKLTNKKSEKVFLTADSEFKRKEWVFSLNYYKTLILKDLIKKKNDAAGIKTNTHESTVQMKTPKNNFFKSSILDKNANNPDFYDVFSPNNNDEGGGKQLNNNNNNNNNKILRNQEIPIKSHKTYKNAPVFFTEPDGAKNLGIISINLIILFHFLYRIRRSFINFYKFKC